MLKQFSRTPPHARRLVAAMVVLCAIFLTPVARAVTPDNTSPRAFMQALASNNGVSLYSSPNASGFKLGSSYFSGATSGNDAASSLADAGSNQKLYALLIDGRYDFNYENQALASPLHPYIAGGVGVATIGQNNTLSQSGDAVPLFRLGGGVAYRLDQRWNLSLDYKRGQAAPTAGDQLFTGRGQQAVDLQALNLGMSFAF